MNFPLSAQAFLTERTFLLVSRLYQTIRFYAKKTSKIKIEFYRKKNVKRGILIYGDREESHTGFLQKAIWRNPKNFVC